MSWEPAWIPDGRGGFRRNHSNNSNDDVEEGEESGEMKEPTPEKKSSKREDDEEEGEITPLPSGGGDPQSSGHGQGPPRSSSTGNLDFRTPYRGRGPNNSRFASRDRPRQRNSFSGALPSQRYQGPSTSGGSGFGREGNFSGGNSGTSFSPRDAQPPPPPPPPPSYREPPSFREPHGSRDMMDGPPPRSGRDFRDFGPGQSNNNLRGDTGSFGSRDFRTETSALGRDFVDAPANRDFRNDQAPPPPRDSRTVEQSSFRGEPSVRDFRDPLAREFRGAPGLSDPPPRDYRSDSGTRDFRGGPDLMSREYRGGDAPSRDFRERNDGVALVGRDFRGTNLPSKRDVFGRDPYQNPNLDRPPAMIAGPGDNREGFNAPPFHREPASFGGNKSSTAREQSPYRDRPAINASFREGDAVYRDASSKDASFRDGHRDAPFRELSARDPRESQSKDIPFQGVSRDRDLSFGKRDSASRDGRESYARGDLIDRSRPVDGIAFDSKKTDHKRESFGSGISQDNSFARDQTSRMGGPSNGPRIVPPFHREGNRDLIFHVNSNSPADRDSSMNKNLKVSHHRAPDISVGQGSSSVGSSAFQNSAANPTLAIGLQGSSKPTTTRPTDPRRRSSKELTNATAQQGIPSVLPQEGGNKTGYSLLPESHPPSGVGAAAETLPEKPPIPPPLHPTRRMGSYSSLADNSTIPTALIPTGQPSSDRANIAAPRSGSGGFRSPLPRRAVSDSSPRNERTDYYGPLGGVPQGRLRSPASDRSRPIHANAASSPSKVGMQNKQQPTTVTQQHAPLAPVITGRPPHFRQNDPRFKHQERVKAEQQAASLLVSSGRVEDGAKFSARVDSQHEMESPTQQQLSAKVESDCRTGADDTNGPSKMKDSVDDTKSLIHKAVKLPPAALPVKQHGNRVSGSNCNQNLPTHLNVDPQSNESNDAQTNDSPERIGNKQLAVQENAHNGKGPQTGSPDAAIANDGSSGKMEDLLPLLTSSLGDKSVVERAEAAVRELELVISAPLVKKTQSEDQSELPTKQQIMEAVTELEKMIKESQKALEDASHERIAVHNEEEEMHRKKLEHLEEEEKQRQAQKQRRELERKEEEETLKVMGLQKAIKDNEALFLDARKRLEDELEDQISQAKDDEKRRCYQDMESQMSNASDNFDKDIAKAKRDLEKAKSAAQNVEAKVSYAESQYRTLLETKNVNKDIDSSIRGTGIPASSIGNVMSITAKNKLKASEAHMLSLSMLCDSQELKSDSSDEELLSRSDPIYGKTFEEWNVLAKQVTGLSDALYTEPVETPYFEQNERFHSSIGPSVKEYVRDNRRRLLEHWTQLAEEYEVRKRLYERQQKKITKKAQRGSITVAGRKSILCNKEAGERPGFERVGAILEPGSRPSNNPYRRARRGNEVRSEYEQDLIIAEIAAKEAMEKRITHGSSKLPRQICRLERELSASYVNTFTAQKVDDPLQEAQSETTTNVWTDMEKCIFLDRFLQFPKDFRRIASFLRNKSTKDCIAFYYDSKQSVQYKGALKEHMMRRKRRGDYQIWDASIQSAISVGASVTAGSSTEKPVVFSLPTSDRTFNTRFFHPLKRCLLDKIVVNDKLEPGRVGGEFEDQKPRSRKRNRDPLFSLGKEHTKFLCQASQDSLAGMHLMKVPVDSAKTHSEDGLKTPEMENSTQNPIRKPPQKWTATEKKIFLETLEEHGRDWAMLAKAVGTKSISQIKNYYYDFKKQSGKYKSANEKKLSKQETATSPNGVDMKVRNTPEHIERIQEADGKIDSARVVEPRRVASRQANSNFQVSSTREGPGVSADGKSDGHRIVQAADTAQRRSSQVDSNLGSLLTTRRGNESADPARIASLASPEGMEYGDSNHVLLQQLLTQQLQHHEHQQHRNQENANRQPLTQPHLHIGQQPQAPIQQLLGQHHRDSHQQGQAALEEVHRLLQQQQTHSHHQQTFSNLLPWVTASQLVQNPARLQHSHHDANQAGDINDVANIQRLLQLQQSQTPYSSNSSGHNALGSLLASAGGIAAASNSGIPSSLLSQLDQLGTSSGSSEPVPTGISALSGAQGLESLSALAGAQGLLGFGANNRLSGPSNTGLNSLAGTGLYRQTPTNSGAAIDAAGVSDALNLITGAFSRREGAGHGFSAAPEGSEGSRFH